MSDKYETVIGVEIHVELGTKTKLFCSCRTDFGSEPNMQTCPVCLGMPGILPVVNERAVEYGVKAALAMNCQISEHSIFERKNYFYPDLPKGYQISQLREPLSHDGYVNINTNGKTKRIGIRRLHLEDDAAKSVHTGEIDESLTSYVDFNRSGVPLFEIVSEPDMSSTEEMKAYCETVKSILEYIYSPQHYYRRVKTFLREYKPPKLHISLDFQSILVFFRSVYRLGIIGKERVEYLKLLVWTLLHRPKSFPLAVTFAIYGYHFRKTCEQHVALG